VTAGEDHFPSCEVENCLVSRGRIVRCRRIFLVWQSLFLVFLPELVVQQIPTLIGGWSPTIGR